MKKAALLSVFLFLSWIFSNYASANIDKTACVNGTPVAYSVYAGNECSIHPDPCGMACCLRKLANYGGAGAMVPGTYRTCTSGQSIFIHYWDTCPYCTPPCTPCTNYTWGSWSACSSHRQYGSNPQYGASVCGCYQEASTRACNSTPSGPTISVASGGSILSYNITVSGALDADNDNIKYQFDWNNDSSFNTGDTETGWVASGSTQTVAHTWGVASNITIKVRACDNYSTPACSGWVTASFANATCGTNAQNYSGGTTIWPSLAPISFCATGAGVSGVQPVFMAPGGSVFWTCLGLGGGLSINCSASRNPLPPIKPTLTGPSTGNVNTDYNFIAVSSIPAGGNLQYKFDWNNDGASDQSTGYVSSGTSQFLPYKWSAAGNKFIKVEACDTYGACSPWSDVFNILISNCIATSPSWNECNQTCGAGGTQTRTVIGTDCLPNNQTQPCNTVPCPQWKEVIP